MKNDKRVLIVGTVPFKKNGSSRAFDSYFSKFSHYNLAQIFSNPEKPLKGHCGYLFQITDKMLLKRLFRKKTVVGEEYIYKELDECSTQDNLNANNNPGFF